MSEKIVPIQWDNFLTVCFGFPFEMNSLLLGLLHILIYFKRGVQFVIINLSAKLFTS